MNCSKTSTLRDDVHAELSFQICRRGWQRKYSSLITRHQVTVLGLQVFLMAANQCHLRNLNFDCEEI